MENQDPRPKFMKHPLGVVLNSYSNKSQNSFDPEFAEQIRKLAPHWFKKGT